MCLVICGRKVILSGFGSGFRNVVLVFFRFWICLGLQKFVRLRFFQCSWFFWQRRWGVNLCLLGGGVVFCQLMMGLCIVFFDQYFNMVWVWCNDLMLEWLLGFCCGFFRFFLMLICMLVFVVLFLIFWFVELGGFCVFVFEVFDGVCGVMFLMYCGNWEWDLDQFVLIFDDLCFVGVNWVVIYFYVLVRSEGGVCCWEMSGEVLMFFLRLL